MDVAVVNPDPLTGESAQCDLLVVGSGGGGLAAALTAQSSGLDVIVAEKEEHFGGATARSGGWLWIPGNSLAKQAGLSDSFDEALRYMRHEAGNHFDGRRASAFLRAAPEMLEFIRTHSPVRFGLFQQLPDYHPTAPGGNLGGRVVYACAWNPAPLGKHLARLRAPLQAMTAYGVQIGNEDLASFATAGRKWSSFLRVSALLAKGAIDRFRSGESMRVTSGRALIGGLAAAGLAKGMRLWTSAPVRTLQACEGRVSGAILEHKGRRIQVHARRGVVLATGGFPHDTQLRNALLEGTMSDCSTNAAAWGLLPHGNTGDGIRLGQAVGGRFSDEVVSPIAWSPVTRAPGAEGDLSLIPVFINRAVPGQICVTRRGGRFANEGASYHDWGVALAKATLGDSETAAWFVCDAASLKKYGLAGAPPWPMPHDRLLRSGYLKRGGSVRELASIAGIDPDGLSQTVSEFNDNARNGRDPVFDRGGNAYDHVNGDSEHRPNPCLGPLDTSPYFAVKATAGCGGTHAGLLTNEHAQVLKADGEPIAGLYAVGNDAAAVTGGTIIAGGCTIGPAMTFGYLAAKHAAGN